MGGGVNLSIQIFHNSKEDILTQHTPGEGVLNKTRAKTKMVLVSNTPLKTKHTSLKIQDDHTAGH